MPKRIFVGTRSKDEWEMDTKSYVLIRVDKNEKLIEARVMKIEDVHKKGGYKKGGELLADYAGKNPEDLYYRIIKDGWITSMQHAAYLGSELRKAFIALQAGKDYVQDEELTF